MVGAMAVAILAANAHAVVIREYKHPGILFQEQSPPGLSRLDWNQACADISPGCYWASGQALICYSNPRGGFSPDYGAGCYYDVKLMTPPYGDNPNWFGQHWVLPRRTCGDSSWTYSDQTGLCERATNYQDQQSCPVANPVYPADGSKRQQEMDFSASILGRTLDFSRTYYTDSLIGYGQTYGWGWSLDRWSRSLMLNDLSRSNLVIAKRDGGRHHLLVGGSNGIWSASPYDGLQLTRSGSGWLLTDRDTGTEETYDANGVLLSLNERDGRSFILGYSTASTPSSVAPAAGLLISVQAADGKTIGLTYDGAGRMVTVSLGSNVQVQFSYRTDLAELLAGVTHSDSTSRSYLYESDKSSLLVMPTEQQLFGNLVLGGQASEAEVNDPTRLMSVFQFVQGTNGRRNVGTLTGILDETSSRYSTYTYDASGRVIDSQHAGGTDDFQFAYNQALQQTIVTDPLGTQRTYSYTTILGVVKGTGQSQPGGSGCGASSSSMSYDANGNVASRVDFAGHKVCYQNDLARNLETWRVEGLASSADCAGALASPPVPTTANPVRTINTTWHPDWRLEARRAEPKKLTTWVYNGQADPTAGGAVASCAPADALLPDGKPIAVLCKKIERATTDGSGASGFSAAVTGSPRTWGYTYTRYGQVLTADGPRTDVNDVTTYTYYDAADADIGKRGNLASITNALGQVTQFTSYDANGRITGLLDPNGVVTSFTYDLRGRLTGKTVGGEATGYTYDPAGQLIQVSLPDGSSLAYTYDPAHRLTAITDGLGNKIQYALDAMGNRTKEDVLDPTGSLAQTRSRVYDALNRLYQDIGAQNQTTTYAYDANGNLTGITDPLSHTTVQGFDALDRLIQITDPGTGQTRFAYDGLDRLVQVTDPRNLVTGYTVDGLGNRSGQQSPDTGTTAQGFDAAGNLVSRTDAKNQATQYQYDALNRLTQVTLADGSRQTYTWNIGTNGIGRLGRIVELNGASQETGRTEYGYDVQGRIVRETRSIGGLPYVTAYTYANGRLASMTYPSGRLVEYGYDGIGRVSQISTTPAGGSSQIVVNNVAYQPFGTVKSFTYGNGQTYVRGIDQDGRIASYTPAGQTQAVGYDGASRISFLSDAGNPANTVNYGYDALDRLTSASLPGTGYGYGYDATGNRTSQTVGAASIPYTVSSTSNRLQTVGSSPPKSYSYDANGSVIGDGNVQYGYDVRGRLNQTTTAQGVTAYQVNAQGERLRKTGGGSDRLYHYDRQGRLIAEGGAQGQIDREYIYLYDLPVAVVVE